MRYIRFATMLKFAFKYYRALYLRSIHFMDAYEEGSGGRRQKPCRACNDFKTWAKMGPGKGPDNNFNNKSTGQNSAMHLLGTNAGASSLISGKIIKV